MEFFKALLLGVIQGITEWLPVSSTGHMLLVDALLPMKVSDACRNLFLVVVQLGSILAVIVLYWHTLNPFSPKKNRQEKQATWLLWGKVAVASIPVAVIGYLADEAVDQYLHGWQVIVVALFVYGVLYIVWERYNQKREARIGAIGQINWKTAFLTGCFQALAIVPGTSRSGSTILGGMVLGMDRPVASQFSFFMAIPPMFGASLLKLTKLGFGLSGQEWGIVAVGTVTAFVVSLFALRFLVSYVRSHDFSVFGWYRIVLAIVVTAFFLSTAHV
ncbi:MAG: undecaprenyl-diphosphate phosphatase [Sphaerochaeta sp.]|jgi:undecaprenyl-diphosphatase|nr:undecaprenyl-diphosphate phosphatase [Sphaerochaeta sp.]MCI2076924.1 undecaprenyl-diphosphate phosphatase [Sphaerochaeta sp.]MCI2096919.1 undecaprenyl-diphosphate phosphatase [Sphaerochaeta sp.]MCI2103935.1 undecaprenyl-diphosphate phosphatase [Sphaerochaeta sp.]